MMNIIRNRDGFSLLELVLALAVFAIGAIATGYLYIDSSISSNASFDRGEAGILATEGLEAVISIRDRDFDELSGLIAGTTYYLVFENGLYWVLATTPVENLGSGDKFERSILIDPDVDLADPGLSYINATATVSWTTMRGVENNEAIGMKLTNWRYERLEIEEEP